MIISHLFEVYVHHAHCQIPQSCSSLVALVGKLSEAHVAVFRDKRKKHTACIVIIFGSSLEKLHPPKIESTSNRSAGFVGSALDLTIHN